MPHLPLFVGPLLCLAGLILLLRALFYSAKHKQQQTWIETKAEVTSIEEVVEQLGSGPDDTAQREKITVKYTLNGKEIVTSALYKESVVESSTPYIIKSKFKTGWLATIYYNPNNPQQIVFVNEKRDYELILNATGGILLIVMGIVMAVS